MPGMLLQRWTMGAGGFIGEVSLFELSSEDLYIKHGSKRAYVELSNLHIHPLRRGQGWADSLMTAALCHARNEEWHIFLRAIPYNNPTLTADELIAFYSRYGFRSTKYDPREMVCTRAR